jgi:hypothetical protein
LTPTDLTPAHWLEDPDQSPRRKRFEARSMNR